MRPLSSYESPESHTSMLISPRSYLLLMRHCLMKLYCNMSTLIEWCFGATLEMGSLSDPIT